MSVETLSDFFMWCTIINSALLLLWAILFRFAPDLIVRLQQPWAHLPEQQVRIMLYGFLAVFKIFVIIFNLVPFLVLKFVF